MCEYYYTCERCSITEKGNSGSPKGWASVYHGQSSLHFCPSCWKLAEAVLIPTVAAPPMIP